MTIPTIYISSIFQIADNRAYYLLQLFDFGSTEYLHRSRLDEINDVANINLVSLNCHRPVALPVMTEKIHKQLFRYAFYLL